MCVRARVCVLKLRSRCSAPKPIFLSGSSSIPPIPHCLAHSLAASPTPFSASRICFAVGCFTFGFSCASSVAAFQAPAATSHSFSVSSREIDRLHFSDSSSRSFKPEPRSDSIFETFSIDLRQKPNRAALARSSRHFGSNSPKNPCYFSGDNSYVF